MLALAVATYVAGALDQRFLIDDAFITFRYSRNWAEGLGLNYNPGVVPPVEGYSNPLWMALLSLAHRVGLSIEVTSQVLSVACGVLLIAFVHRWLLRQRVGWVGVVGCDFAIATAGAMWVWATSGLETTAFACALCVLLLSLLDFAARPTRRASIGLGALALALALLRVEGVAWALVLPLVVLATTEERRRFACGLSPYFVVVAVGFAAFVGARFAHFEAWVPNTALVKAGFSLAKLRRGLETDASFLLMLAPPAMLVAAAWASGGPRARAGRAIGAALVALLGTNALVGGDWMPFYRFLVPFWALGAVALGLALDRLRPRLGVPIGLATCVLGALPLFGIELVPRSIRAAVHFRSFQGGYMTELERLELTRTNGAHFQRIGRLLGRVAEPGASVVTGAIGAIGFYSRLHVHDRNGLVDPEVARRAPIDPEATAGHEKRVPWSWFTERAPTYYEPACVGRNVPLRIAAATHGARVFRKDPALRDDCIAVKLVGEPVDPLTTEWALIVLAGVSDPVEARRFWDRLLP